MSLDSPDSFTAMLASCTAAAACWGGTVWAARRLASRCFPGESLSVRCCAAGILALSFVVLVSETLGTLGLLATGPVTVVCLAFVGFAAASDCKTSLAGDVRDAVRWLRRRIAEGYGLLLCVVALLMSQAVLRGLRSPPLSWDSLTYHVFLPARWIQLGGLTPFAAPGCIDTARAYPINLELLVAWAMLPFGTDLFVNLINLPVMLLGGLGLYALVRAFEVPPRLAVWAPALFCFSPAVWALITTQYADILVCTAFIVGLLFLVRAIHHGRAVDVLFAGAGFGLAVGTKFTALPLAALALAGLVLHVVIARPSRRRSLGWLAAAVVVGAATGGYQYCRNWVELGNPVYPYGVAIAGHTVFEQSPLTAEVVRETPAGSRADDWEHLKRVFSPSPLTWGTKYLLILPAALLVPLLARRNRFSKRLLGLLCFGVFLSFYASDSGLAAVARRLFIDSSARYLAAPMAVGVCLAVVGAAALRWPRGLVPVVPTVAVIADAWCGQFPQPLSFGESFAIVLAIIGVLWLLAAGGIDATVTFLTRRRWALASMGAVGLICFSAGAASLDAKRQRTRYGHYSTGAESHPLRPGLASGWEACDEPERPHVIALVRRTHGDEVEGPIFAASRWFWYPLVGSRLQNRAVYASVLEPRDLPSPKNYGWLSDDGEERIWLGNLRRLGVDRLFVVPGARPEESWIAARPDVFVPIEMSDQYRIYRVMPPALTLALAESASEQFCGIGVSSVSTPSPRRCHR